MKAKEWATQFKQNNLKATCQAFAEETLTLIKQRGNSDQAILSSIREQEKKFQAIERILNNKDDRFGDLFLDIMEVYCNKEWQTYLKLENRAQKLKAQRNAYLCYKQEVAKANKEQDPELRLALLFAAIIGRSADQDEIDFNYGKRV